jgi:Na+/H+ antiporter
VHRCTPRRRLARPGAVSGNFVIARRGRSQRDGDRRVRVAGAIHADAILPGQPRCMHQDLLLVIGLLFAITVLTPLGARLHVAQPLVLVLAGLALAFVPGLPAVTLAPDLVFLIFLPPLLYEAAWFTSWREFRRWRRSILMLAFGLVLFTSVIVGYVTSAVIPGVTLAMGFLLGGIVSPPDAVAATSVLKGLRIPKRATTILEGESLVNDASSLIVFRFALAAVVTGHFSVLEATRQFVVVTVGGVIVGVALAALICQLHRSLTTTPAIDTALTVMSPYVMYIAAEELHWSGVMSVVSGGLFLSRRAHAFLDYKSRMQAYAVWSTLGFVLNGLVFILIGLELTHVRGLLDPGEFPRAVGYGLFVSVLVIAIRFVWMYPAAHLPRLLFPAIAAREPDPGWRLPTMIAWAGMRGVVSLAAALSIPQTLPGGEPFPQRGTLLVITFVVILVTLVGQGLTLPWLVRTLQIEDVDDAVPEDEQELALRADLAAAVLTHLAAHPGDTPRVARAHAHYTRVAARTRAALDDLRAATHARHAESREFQRTLIGVQRERLGHIREASAYDDDVVRKVESALDLEEARLNG